MGISFGKHNKVRHGDGFFVAAPPPLKAPHAGGVISLRKLMSTELESRLVFVDTSAYESKNYQFNEHALGKLCGFIESERLHLLITQITINEIKAHLLSKAEESARAIKKNTKRRYVLKKHS